MKPAKPAKPTHQPATYGDVQAGAVRVELVIRHRKRDGDTGFELGIAKVYGVERVVFKHWDERVWRIMDGRQAKARLFKRATIGR